jgi:hypothetical protein
MSIKEKRTVAVIYLTEVYCSMTLEDYKQQVYDYLTTKLGRTTQQARNLMKGYENLFQGYLDDGWTVPMMATAVLYNY